MQVTVQFLPDFAKRFEETIFVELHGRADRVPLAAAGVGIGPCATFSFDVLDVGNTFINTSHHYALTLENRGEVPVPFRLAPATGPLAHAFTVEPTSGTVAVDDTMELGVQLLADRLGKFDEKMLLHVAGTDAPLAVQFKGWVVGPTFEASVSDLDFGVVAFGFRCVPSSTLPGTDVSCRLHWNRPEVSATVRGTVCAQGTVTRNWGPPFVGGCRFIAATAFDARYLSSVRQTAEQ